MVKIIYKNNNPFIQINDEIIPPTAFRSFRPQPYNIAEFERIGGRLYQMIVSGKLNANGDKYSLYGPVWVGDNKYDFSAFDRQINMFMKYAPDGYFCIMIQLDTPDWWLEKHPEWPDSFYKLNQTTISEEWKTAAANYLQAFIKYAEEKYGDKIFAYSYSCGLCTEWFCCDYGVETAQKLDAYKKYLGDENAVIPDLLCTDDGDTCDLRAPDSNERKYMDFCCSLNNNLVTFFAKKAQEILNHNKLIGVFYGYIDQGTALKQNLWFTNLYAEAWKSNDIDILFSPASYNDNRHLDGVPLFQYAIDSLPLNNKLYLHEIDHRTDLAMYPLGTGNFMQDCYETAEDSINVLRRELCITMLKSGAFWWFDFYGGYFATPQYEAELKRQLEIYNMLSECERNQVAEVAVFVDGPSMNLMKERVNLVPECVRSNLTEITKSGAMLNTFNLCDLPKIDVNKYKLFVFLNALDIPYDILECIETKLKDKYKFYVYAPNICENNLNKSGVEKILDMKLEYAQDGIKKTAVYNEKVFGFEEAVSPLFIVNDTTAEPVAMYQDGGVCIAKKGRTFYSATGNIPYEIWQYAEKEAGVHIYNDSGCYVAVTDSFIAMQNTKSDDCIINLPFDCEVEELFDGGNYKTSNCTLRYNTKKGTTKIFKIKRG